MCIHKYIYIDMYICTYVCTYICTYICIYICTYNSPAHRLIKAKSLVLPAVSYKGLNRSPQSSSSLQNKNK